MVARAPNASAIVLRVLSLLDSTVETKNVDLAAQLTALGFTNFNTQLRMLCVIVDCMDDNFIRTRDIRG